MSSVWQDIHSSYQNQTWINKPSIFAETAIQHFPKAGKLLELGSGHGQDSFFFAKYGYDVVSTDIETAALTSKLRDLDKVIKEKITIFELDLKNPFPFPDESFDVVFAHLSLHYFDHQTTVVIFKEIRRLLRPEGVFAFLANSVNDPEYQTGTQLEPDFFLIDRATKRYFSIESAKKFTEHFRPYLLDDQGETYKDRVKGVSKLIRFIGSKPRTNEDR